MVTQTVTDARKLDTADGGYATPGKTQLVERRGHTVHGFGRHGDPAGPRRTALTYRLRKPGFRDANDLDDAAR